MRPSTRRAGKFAFQSFILVSSHTLLLVHANNRGILAMTSEIAGRKLTTRHCARAVFPPHPIAGRRESSWAGVVQRQEKASDVKEVHFRMQLLGMTWSFGVYMVSSHGSLYVHLMLAPQATAMRWTAQDKGKTKEKDRWIRDTRDRSGVVGPTINRSYLSNQFRHLESRPS
jgi:hypothetical protein